MEVKQDLHCRIQALAERGAVFEEGAAYEDNDRDAEDAKLILQSRDPAAYEAQRQGARFVQHRVVRPERRHWVASMQGFM